MVNNDFLFKQITEKIAETDLTGYTIQYPPLFVWKPITSEREILSSWGRIPQKNLKYLGLYIHIPFCRQRCYFCRYFSTKLKQPKDLSDYLLALKKEIKIYQKSFHHSPVRSIYFGGGTPSLLNVKQLDDLFNYLYKNFNLSRCRQIVFEGTPDFLDFKKLKVLKKWGVNRLTIGVQSLDPKVIKAANRYQLPDSFVRCFFEARRAGIENINVDLMVGLPLQTEKSVAETLKAVIKLQPEMIHVHPFYPTPFTLFMKRGQKLSRADMDLRTKMASMSQKIISQTGCQPIKFDADGKSEAARNIQLSDAIEHNAPFLGLGAGAVSHATNYFRYVNTTDIGEYRNILDKGKLPILSACRLNKKDEMIYFVTACLRYGTVSKYQFKKLFNQDLDKVFQKEIKYLAKRRLIKNGSREITSLMKNIGEYLVFSKYFYGQKIINKCKKELNWKGKAEKINKEELKYMCL